MLRSWKPIDQVFATSHITAQITAENNQKLHRQNTTDTTCLQAVDDRWQACLWASRVKGVEAEIKPRDWN